MRTGASYLRVIVIMVIAFFLLEFTVDSGEQLAIVKYPIIWAVLTMILLFAIAIEVVSETLKSILLRGLNKEAQERFLASEKIKEQSRFAGIKGLYKKLLGSKPIEKEGEIVLDHNYDGIKELDNSLPPWWVYMFYATIVFAAVYLIRYQVFGDTNQIEEYEIAMEQARADVAEYKKTAKDLVDVNTVELLTEPADLTAGKTIFTTNCVVCHKADGGGGIGPNLTDAYWILGGGIKNVFNTISEGGRDGKGMVAWKTELSPLERAQVGSYLLTFQGTTPAEPKAAEGEIWIDPDAPKTEALKETNEAVTDSTSVDLVENN
jgi:cytochrome c oxidase cbb3-type subunit 3